MILRPLVLVALLAAAPTLAREHYAGQFDNVDPATRAWFKSVKSPHGVPCCDIADGHMTDYKTDAQGHFFVPINSDDPEDPWVLVPPEAVVYDAGNPYEKAVVWFVRDAPGSIYIRCFVPTGGV